MILEIPVKYDKPVEAYIEYLKRYTRTKDMTLQEAHSLCLCAHTDPNRAHPYFLPPVSFLVPSVGYGNTVCLSAQLWQLHKFLFNEKGALLFSAERPRSFWILYIMYGMLSNFLNNYANHTAIGIIYDFFHGILQF